MIPLLVGFMAKCVAVLLRHLSPSERTDVVGDLIHISIQRDSTKRSLEFLLHLENYLYQIVSKASLDYGKGIHTKHRHTNYSLFFIKNLNKGERVLDIGSGIGFMCYKMVTHVPRAEVVGIEINETYVKYAHEHYKHQNLRFIHGDVLKQLPNGKFDVVTLSNVLEHIENRIEFLRMVVKKIKPKRLIIRVPLFERDWHVPLKKELGIDYRLDSTHLVEYTQEDFVDELRRAGLKPTQIEIRWGEIWSVAEPLT